MIVARNPTFTVMQPLRDGDWKWFPCCRCGRRNRVRMKRANYICRDCRLSDPDYVKMIQAKEEPCPDSRTPQLSSSSR